MASRRDFNPQEIFHFYFNKAANSAENPQVAFLYAARRYIEAIYKEYKFKDEKFVRDEFFEEMYSDYSAAMARGQSSETALATVLEHSWRLVEASNRHSQPQGSPPPKPRTGQPRERRHESEDEQDTQDTIVRRKSRSRARDKKDTSPPIELSRGSLWKEDMQRRGKKRAEREREAARENVYEEDRERRRHTGIRPHAEIVEPQSSYSIPVHHRPPPPQYIYPTQFALRPPPPPPPPPQPRPAGENRYSLLPTKASGMLIAFRCGTRIFHQNFTHDHGTSRKQHVHRTYIFPPHRSTPT